MIDAIDSYLDEMGFDPESNILTYRQAQVLALRANGASQAAIADAIGTSRANISSIEGSARTNIEKAREAIRFAEALSAPVQLTIPAETDLYDVPQLVYDACDDASVKVEYTAPSLMKVISDKAGSAVTGRNVKQQLHISVTTGGEVTVQTEVSVTNG